jgi:WD40 repeat protein
VAISADDHFLVSGGHDGKILVHRVEEGDSFALAGHKSAVDEVAISPDSRTLLSAGADGFVRYWRLPPTIADP